MPKLRLIAGLASLVLCSAAAGCAAPIEEPAASTEQHQQIIPTPEDLAERLQPYVDAGNCQYVYDQWHWYAWMAGSAMPIASNFMLHYLDKGGDRTLGYSPQLNITETRIWDALRFDPNQTPAQTYFSRVPADALRAVHAAPTRGEWTRLAYTPSSSACSPSGNGCLIATLVGPGRSVHVPVVDSTVNIRPDLGYALGRFTMTPRVYIRKRDRLFTSPVYEIAVQHDYYDFYDWTEGYQTDVQMNWLDTHCHMAKTYNINGTSAPYGHVAEFTCSGTTCTQSRGPQWTWLGRLP
jgi:hypothetical protein